MKLSHTLQAIRTFFGRATPRERKRRRMEQEGKAPIFIGIDVTNVFLTGDPDCPFNEHPGNILFSAIDLNTKKTIHQYLLKTSKTFHKPATKRAAKVKSAGKLISKAIERFLDFLDQMHEYAHYFLYINPSHTDLAYLIQILRGKREAKDWEKYPKGVKQPKRRSFPTYHIQKFLTNSLGYEVHTPIPNAPMALWDESAEAFAPKAKPKTEFGKKMGEIISADLRASAANRRGKKLSEEEKTRRAKRAADKKRYAQYKDVPSELRPPDADRFFKLLDLEKQLAEEKFRTRFVNPAFEKTQIYFDSQRRRHYQANNSSTKVMAVGSSPSECSEIRECMPGADDQPLPIDRIRIPKIPIPTNQGEDSDSCPDAKENLCTPTQRAMQPPPTHPASSGKVRSKIGSGTPQRPPNARRGLTLHRPESEGVASPGPSQGPQSASPGNQQPRYLLTPSPSAS